MRRARKLPNDFPGFITVISHMGSRTCTVCTLYARTSKQTQQLKHSCILETVVPMSEAGSSHDTSKWDTAKIMDLVDISQDIVLNVITSTLSARTILLYDISL